MKKQRSRVIAIVLAVVLVVAGVFAVMTVSGADDNSAATHYFYDQLTPNQTIFYKALEKMYKDGMLKTGTASLDVTDPDALENVVSKELAEAYMKGNNPMVAGNLLSDFAAARDAFYYDYPSIFYVDFSALSIRATSKGAGENAEYHIYICAERYDTYYTQGFSSEEEVEAAITEYEEALNALVEGAKKVDVVDGQDKKAAQVGYVHDTLIRSVSYRLENACKPANIGFIRTAYGALVKHEGVCEAYTRAFKAAMDKLGIPCVMVYGAFMHDSETPEDHIWDYVQLDGSWYGVDATMDDPISKKDFLGLPEGTDGYENREYFLAGADVMGRQHYPSGILSPANYEFTYPTLAPKGYGSEAVTTDSALSVLINYNGTDQDEGDTQATVFRVSYLGMGAQKCIDNGYYLLQRDVKIDDDTNEYIYGDWFYLLPEAFYIPGDREEYVDLALSYNGLVQFGVTTRSPGNYFNQPDLLFYYGSEGELLSSTSVLKVSSNYKVPPYPKTTTPTMRGDLMIGSTYTIDIEYTENLKRVDGEKLDVKLECFYYERVKNSYGLYEKRRVNVSAGVKNSLLYDIEWDESTPNKVSFKFRPSEDFSADSVFYTFNIKGLVGEESDKAPIEVTYGASHPCAVCALKSQGWDWNVFAKPQLIDNQDLSLNDWETADGEAVSDLLKHRLTLVTTTTTQRESDTMNELIDEQFPGEEVQKSETYNIKLTVCKKQIIQTGQSVYISLGFPEGYGPEDEGVTFKAYHFKKDDAGNTIGVEEIPCIITQYGLIIKVNSFSPFAIAAVTDDGKSEPADTNVILTTTAGGTIKGTSDNGTIYTLKGDSDTITVKAEEGYVLDTLTVNGKAVDDNVAGKDTYSLSVDKKKADEHGNVTVSATFVSKTVYNEEVKNEETVEIPAKIEAHKEHVWSDYKCDETGHYRVCTECGFVEAKAPHSRTISKDEDGKDVLPGNCTEDYTCAVCNEKVSGNAEHAMVYVLTKDGKHYQQCTNCQHKTTEEVHSYSLTKSFTKEGHWGVCRCGATSATVEHDLVCVNGNDGTHRWECADAGCSYATVSLEHTLVTFSNEKEHWQGCTDCEYKLEVESHDFTLVSDEAAGHHSVCEKCGYTGKTEVHELKMQSDASGHWEECECGYQTNKADHVTVDDHDCTTKLVCTKCAFVVEEEKEHDFSDMREDVSDTKHKTVCENPGCDVEQEEDHIWSYDKNDNTYHTKRCTVCGHKEQEAHTNWKVEQIPNDNANHKKICPVCEQEVDEEHNWGDWKSEDSGRYTHECKDCGIVVEEAHKWGPWMDDKNGETHTRKCDVHQESETASHTPSNTLVDNKNGTHSVVCAECGAVMETVEHDWGEGWQNADNDNHARRCDCGASEIKPHNWNKKPEQSDNDHHAYVCEDCGVKVLKQHEFVTRSDGKYHWQECKECGYTTEKVEHVLTYVIDGDTHYQKCECGYTTDPVAHEWTTYTDNEDGTHTAKCVCGHSEISKHTYDAKWTVSENKLTHEHKCKDCGSVEAVEHTMVYKHDDTHHWSECTECEYVTEKITHALTNTNDDNYHWAVCSDPNCDYSDEANKKPHTVKYGYDEDGHWSECTECSYRTEKVEHDFDKQHDSENHWDECKDCKYTTEAVNHNFESKHDETTHWDECKDCHYETAHADHNFETKHDETTHWDECKDCHYETAHVDHNFETKHDDTTHWDECKDCHYETVHADHNFETKHDDTTHWDECKDCHYETAHVDHNFETKHDDTTHWSVCKDCDYKTTTEKHDLVGDYDETGHWEKCECGYETEHKDHTLVSKFNETGHWTECECGYKTATEDHNLVSKNDETGHWKECECGYKTATEEHSFKDGVCDCGVIDPNQPSESEPVETEPSETEPDTKPDTPPQTGDESSFMVWAVVVVISAGALVMIAIEFTKRGKKANR